MNKIARMATVSIALISPLLVAQEYSPWADEEFPMNLYWGDTHLHSSYSMDANTMGNTGLTPAEAYRFARGEAVRATTGMMARLNMPLDFLVVSDHAEQMGIMMKLREGDPRLMENPEAQRIYKAMTEARDDAAAAAVMQEFIAKLSQGLSIVDNRAVSFSVWQDSIATAEQYNDPGNFTALIGYEWTSMPQGNNLHRVVVYADDADKAGQMPPQPSSDGDTPEALWSFMEAYEEKTGGRILAIPHNGNLSNGRMFQRVDSDGNDIDAAYAQRRLRWEPLMEVTQIKGDGETHPLLSPNDEFADFENWDAGNFASMSKANKTDDMLQYEYARSALKLGLELEQKTGSNPYQFGMIGSTDAHTSLAAGAENNFWGKATIMEPGMDRTQRSGLFGPADDDTQLTLPWKYVASGYAAVWARENTREALFEAMQRKEVYATTGSRISLRFFGGWEFSQQDVESPDVTRIGYRRGVPMGGELSAPGSKAPGFMTIALKDPNGANLDRIQIVKGWMNDDGELQEKVYNVTVSDGRKIKRNGSVSALKSTVDIENASYRNNIGAAHLSSYWQDPDFERNQRAFYYARVIEIPTPRWPAYDAARLGKTVDESSLMEIQDRAYSSPIWYSPKVRLD